MPAASSRGDGAARRAAALLRLVSEISAEVSHRPDRYAPLHNIEIRQDDRGYGNKVLGGMFEVTGQLVAIRVGNYLSQAQDN